MSKLKSLQKYPGVQIYENKDRKFNGRPDVCYYIRYKNSLGKTVREKIGWASEGITASYASQVRNDRIRAIRLGDEVIPIHKRKKQNVSFDEFMVEKYLPYCKENKSPKSYARESQLYRDWIKPVIGDKPLKEISAWDMERIKKTMKDEDKAPRTIEYALAVVRQAFNRAREWGIYDGDNPVAKVKKPKADNKRIRFLTPSEAKNLLKVCKLRSPQLYEICLLSLYTGMRAGEIFNLKWGDIDLENGIIYIKDPKNRTNRVAYMTPEVKELFKTKIKGEPDELVFKDRKGNKIKEVSNTFAKIVNELGLNDGVTDPRDKVVFHTLRHTFGSWLAQQGVPIYTIKELMGHKTLSMTERYSHLMPDNKRNAVNTLADVLTTKDEDESYEYKYIRSQARQ